MIHLKTIVQIFIIRTWEAEERCEQERQQWEKHRDTFWFWNVLAVWFQLVLESTAYRQWNSFSFTFSDGADRKKMDKS